MVFVTHWMKEFNVMRLFYLPRNLTQWIPLTLFTSEETEAQQVYISLKMFSWWFCFDPKACPYNSI